MSVKAKQWLVAVLGILFLGSLILVQYKEVMRQRAESGLAVRQVSIPASSAKCVACHRQQSPGIVDHWLGSKHAARHIGCVECHQAKQGDVDAFTHHGYLIATIVTPRDCAACHKDEAEEFERSHHSKGGRILHSLDNWLAEVVEGARVPFNPHAPTPGRPDVTQVNGMASAFTGCQQCHGSKVALLGRDGTMITVDDLKPDENGQPTNKAVLEKIQRDEEGKPKFHPSTWPNTGIGRFNLDGSRGSCSACHSRHDFSPRRARQPENCAKCHLGPDHPQKEIFEESKHGVAYRDLKDAMNLDADKWVLGEDYSAAPTCATCHMSAHSKGGKITHDPGERLSWTNRPPVSLVMDTDKNGAVVKETDPAKRREQVAHTWQQKRDAMKQVCLHCHTPDYVNAFYTQYDDFIINYNEKFAKPGKAIMDALKAGGFLTKPQFDEEIEWVWFYLWHHEGRRARHGASMMAPDYAHWHGMYEVAERFYMQLIPLAREAIEHGRAAGKKEEADRVERLIEEILSRPEHKWQAQAAKLHKAVKEGTEKEKTAKNP